MANETWLLRMLEPAVRPGGLPGPASSSQVRRPIESQSFEEMLQQQARAGPAAPAPAQRQTIDAAADDETEGPPPAMRVHASTRLLMQLGSFDQLDNAALRHVLDMRETAVGKPFADTNDDVELL